MALHSYFSLPMSRLTATLVVAALLYPAATTRAQSLLLRDDFAGEGLVNTSVWRLPFEEEGRFVGRTLYRNDSAVDIPLQGIDEPLASDSEVMEIYLDTYSEGNPGVDFLGTDLLTKRNFARAGGITFAARMRLKPTTTGGLVNGFFMYDLQGDDPPGSGDFLRDEIDVELLSNEVAGDNRVFTNYWNDGPFSGDGSGGDGQFTGSLGIDLTQFQDYRVEWTPRSIKWFVNDSLVRTVTDNVPDDPMKLHVNLWAPDSGFPEAFNAALQPASTPGANQRFAVQVDHVEVNRINTEVSDNLLVDPSFENETEIFQDNATGGWRLFNNANFAFDDPSGTNPNVPDAAADGVVMLSTFGPFFDNPNASGAFQNVAAEEGQQFEASVVAQTLDTDSIEGKTNFTTLSLAFLDSAGNVLQEEFGSPENLVDTNGQSAPLLDGRDPNLIEDAWVEAIVDAVAPAGTALARLNLFFVQLDMDSGAVWFDDASLVRLDALLLPLPADFNKDGFVDGEDFLIWQANFGAQSGGTSNTGDANDDGAVDGEDFLIWQASFGNASGSAGGAVPEPAAAALLLLAVAGFATRRRR